MTEICDKLGPIYLKKPTMEDWIKNESGFNAKWNYPNACGAMDGKHVRIRAPAFSGSNNYNYKNFYSIVLLAIVGPDYQFTAVDIGSSGSQSDGGVFARSPLGASFESGTLGLPPPKAVGEKLLPHVILSDDAFSLKPNLMKPYPGKFLPANQRIFNYRMSRARMTVENSFGILSARWRIFHVPIQADIELVKLIVRAAVILHNFLISKNEMMEIAADGPHNENQAFQDLSQQEISGGILSGSQVRDEFCNFFNGEGSVSWQNMSII
ncbi:protein ALP1-like [Folsomia candida]|uniref:Putative nuclease HARBI1 n=1 Tax=Folsomia candida TaxID=158441 RepID=A0A226EC79_FOLCA|nr:protein ALP1-like [Folsomia candida]OXA55232.1 putative nuclease HARBI1 [Folsomia candida]